MASPDVLDFAKLSAPIPGDKPTGADPRADSATEKLPEAYYLEIRDARNKAREAEKMVLRGQEPEALPNWGAVRTLCEKALKEKVKDLEITAYLIEALVRSEEGQFVALRDGFRLAREFLDKFWENLYPTPDEDGILTRLAPLNALNDAEATLIVPILRVPITEASTGPFCLNDYNEGTRLRQSPDANVKKKGEAALELFNKAASETPAPFYQALADGLTACSGEFDKLCEAMRKRYTEAKLSPSEMRVSNIRNTLTEAMNSLKRVAGDKLKPPAPPPSAAGPAPADGQAAAQAAAKPADAPGVLRTRAQAIETLQKVAKFFRETEPHSPVSYSVEQAVRWANMPLPALLAELIGSDQASATVRSAVFTKVGIPHEAGPAKPGVAPAQPPK